MEKVLFLSNWGFHGQALSDALAMAHDNFLIEMGLYGSSLQWDHVEVGHLATDATWFQNLWHLVHTFDVEVVFHKEDLVHGIRENGRSLLAELYHLGY